MASKADRPILVLGATGQVGRELPDALAAIGDVVALDRAAADLRNPLSLRNVVRLHRPCAIVNAAAYTAVDRAEEEAEVADAVNGEAPGVLALEANAIGACIVHYSTDYVFDGRKDAPYTEADTPNPLSRYGSSKLEGERAVIRACPRHLILRTSWVFGSHGSNFLKTMLKLAAERDRLRVVADQHGAPTSAALIAQVTATVLERMLHAPVDDPHWGLYHLAASGETTWHAYARHVIADGHAAGLVLRSYPDDVEPITTADYPVPAARPANSRLDTTRLRQAFHVSLPAWTVGVTDVVGRLARQGFPTSPSRHTTP